MIVRCDVVKNYISMEIHNWCKWLDCDMGKWPRIACLYCIPYRCKREQPDTYNIRDKILKWIYACGNK